MITTLLVFLVILGILVFVHEFGHFIVAKKLGVGVEEFAFGFRPRLWAKKVGETTYALNLIPLGGYVRLFGEQEGEIGPRSFKGKGIKDRFLIFVAGSMMNLILAWFVLTILFAAGFNPLLAGVGNNPFVTGLQKVKITEVSANSPAAQIGLKKEDVILSLNGEKIATDQEFVVKTNQHRGEEVNLKIERDGVTQELKVTPRQKPPIGEGAIGVTIQGYGNVKSSIIAAPAAAVYETGHIIVQSAVGFGNFVRDLIIRQRVSEDVTGIVGVGELTGYARRLGIGYLAQLLVIISASLAVINLMPILPLDGGHVAALIYEKVVRRPLSEKQFSVFWTAGFALVLLFFVVVTYKDFIRFDVIGRIVGIFN